MCIRNGIFIYIEKLMMTGYIDYSYIDFDIFYKYGESAIGDRLINQDSV